MTRTMEANCWLLAGLLLVTGATADEYDFEVGLAFDSTQFDGSQTITTPGGTIFNSSENDTDNLSVSGSWYFRGLSDDKGPRARATFVNRASSLSANYARTDQKASIFLTSNDPAFPIPPIDSTFESDGDTFTVGLRHVDRDSGWFGSVSVLSSDITVLGFVDDSVDATGWTLGGGKYLLETTALGIEVGQVDADGGVDATIIAVTATHLGDLGEHWQYAVDFGYSRADTDGNLELDTLNVTLALYPNRDFEFGFVIEDVSDNSNFIDNTGIEGFASWFVTPNVRLAARYRFDDVDNLGNVFVIGGGPSVSDADQDAFGISATVRF